jgi:ferredoxin
VGRMRIVADTSRCVGAGQCVLTDPAVFDQSQDDGTVVLLTDRVEGEQLARARVATTICPSGAITLAED